jgi:hypothetical protein
LFLLVVRLDFVKVRGVKPRVREKLVVFFELLLEPPKVDA